MGENPAGLIVKKSACANESRDSGRNSERYWDKCESPYAITSPSARNGRLIGVILADMYVNIENQVICCPFCANETNHRRDDETRRPKRFGDVCAGDKVCRGRTSEAIAWPQRHCEENSDYVGFIEKAIRVGWEA